MFTLEAEAEKSPLDAELPLWTLNYRHGAVSPMNLPYALLLKYESH